MKTPPSELKVLGRYIPIRDSEIESAGEYSNGEIEYSSEDTNPDNVRDTILHEWLHWADDVLKIGLKEDQVHRLAPCILQLIRDNPEFVTYLQERG